MESLFQTLTEIQQIQKTFSSWNNTAKTKSDKSAEVTDSPALSVKEGNPTDLSFLDILSGKNNSSLFTPSSPSSPSSPSLRSSPYAALVKEASEKYGLPDSLIKSVIEAESNFDEDAVSPKGAMGLMQLMPATAEQYDVKQPYSPRENIDAGSQHLRNLLNRYDGNLIKALAAYNAGENALRDNQIPGYRETQNYIKKVINNYMKYNGVDL